MCGRMALTLPHDAMAQLFAAVPANALPEVPNYNICPTNQVHAIHTEGGQRRMVENITINGIREISWEERPRAAARPR